MCLTKVKQQITVHWSI